VDTVVTARPVVPEPPSVPSPHFPPVATAAIAAATRRAEREIVEQLRRNGATSPDHAIPLEVHRHIPERRLERLLTAQAVRQTPDGRYWLDEQVYASYRSDRRGIALVLLGIALVTALGVLIARALR
jgi:hypothetical protein